MPTKTILDSEFGEISLRTINSSRSIRARVGTDGRIAITMPPLTPQFIVKRFINSSREALRDLIDQQQPKQTYQHGDQIGKSHTLIVRAVETSNPKIIHDGQQIILSISPSLPIDNPDVQRLIRDNVIKALRKEAKSYLPRRLKFLADQNGFKYERTRFSHAGSRWGSCSSTGTISLNIALMKLPSELIDYVICHELAHTRQMNHSDKFWREVEILDPQFKLHKRQIKKYSPSI